MIKRQARQSRNADYLYMIVSILVSEQENASWVANPVANKSLGHEDMITRPSCMQGATSMLEEAMVNMASSKRSRTTTRRRQ
eukprot:2772396-Pleurochrysis_carterae.AAC.1